MSETKIVSDSFRKAREQSTENHPCRGCRHLHPQPVRDVFSKQYFFPLCQAPWEATKYHAPYKRCDGFEGVN